MLTAKQLHLADGNLMPQFGMGVYKVLDGDELKETVKIAWNAGYRLFDTAQMYENEQWLGEAIHELQIPRSEVFITTKIAETNQGYEATLRSFQISLEKLQMDYVDLLLVHWPIHEQFFETWRAFEHLKDEGLVKSIGVSNYGRIHLEYLATRAKQMPVVDQIEIHPKMSQPAMVEYLDEQNIVAQAWSPLGRARALDDPILVEIGLAHDRSVAQIVLKWHLQRGISIIPKSVHEARIYENARLDDFQLSDEEMLMISQLNQNQRVSKEPELVYEYGYQY